MRNWLAAGALLFLLLLVGLAVAFSRFTTYVNENRDWVAARLSDALQRHVTFDSIVVSLHGGLSATVTNLRIADDPRFGEGDFMAVERAHVVVRVLPALFGDYQLRVVDLEAPTLRIVRDPAGFNLGSIAPARGAASGTAKLDETSVETAIAVLVALLRVDGGHVIFVDRTAQPPTTVDLEDIDASIEAASLTSPVRLEGTAHLMAGDVPGVVLDQPLAVEFSATGTVATLAGRVEIDATESRLAYGGAFVKSGDVPLRLNTSFQRDGDVLRFDPIQIRVADATVSGSATASWGTKPEAKGSLPQQRVAIGEIARVFPALAALDPSGVVDVEADFSRQAANPFQTHGKLSLRDVAVGQPGARIGALHAEIDADQNRIETQTARFTINGSPAEAKGVYDLRSASFHLDLECRGVALKPILETYAPETAARVGGNVDANLQLSGQARKPDGIRRSLAGTGKVAVQEGVLRQINVGEEVLAGATGVRGLTQLVPPSIRNRHPGLLEAADTNFQALGASFRISAGTVSTDDLHVVTPDYTIKGRGELGVDNRLDTHAVLEASEDLTADLIKVLKPAKYLKNSNRRLEVPFRLSGVWPQIKAKADERALLKGIERDTLGEQLGNLLGGKRKKGKTPVPDRDLLQRGLDELFRH